jgi:hypothetical protein
VNVRFFPAVAMAVMFLPVSPAPAFAQAGPARTADAGKVPRTPEGKPDMQGIWETRNAASFDVTEIAEGHEIPYLPEALEREQKGPRVDPIVHCMMPGVPRITYMPFPIQVLQKTGVVIFMYEYLHDIRTVMTNSRPHLDGIDFAMGDSVGHWDGDTLVVDVVDFNDKTWLDSARHTHSDALHVVERYTRVGPNTIDYEATIEDPKTYSRPWKISMPLHRNTEPDFELREQECTEGDNGRAIHPPYRPAPEGDIFEFVRPYPQGASK